MTAIKTTTRTTVEHKHRVEIFKTDLLKLIRSGLDRELTILPPNNARIFVEPGSCDDDAEIDDRTPLVITWEHGEATETVT